ncbi:UNVERIFIED_CONTAM: hypothetical protein K2H54_046808 [Gekko kuhli]
MAMTELIQEDVRALELADTQMKEKMMILETDLKEFNLKFRGFEEDAENTTDLRTKKKILDVARAKGALCYQGKEIQVFPDIPVEAIQKRRELKPFTSKLLAANIKYKWVTLARLRFSHQGSRYEIWDEESAVAVLKALRLAPVQEYERRSQKRKLHFSPSSPQSPKQQNRSESTMEES